MKIAMATCLIISSYYYAVSNSPYPLSESPSPFNYKLLSVLPLQPTTFIHRNIHPTDLNHQTPTTTSISSTAHYDHTLKYIHWIVTLLLSVSPSTIDSNLCTQTKSPICKDALGVPSASGGSLTHMLSLRLQIQATILQPYPHIHISQP